MTAPDPLRSALEHPLMWLFDYPIFRAETLAVARMVEASPRVRTRRVAGLVRGATDRPRCPYDEAVEEAICFGWIDSTNKISRRGAQPPAVHSTRS